MNLRTKAHIDGTEFKAINWFPTKSRIDQPVCVNVINFFNGTAPDYSTVKFPFHKGSYGQKCLSFLGPKIWNGFPSDLKSANNPNTFKHKIKE